MTAVSQSYPNYLGGLNEQPDELKKPGQLTEALNVIPDPVIGLTRRPGFELVGNMSGAQPEGTWFEMELSNQINDDYIYFGCVNPDGTINIINQNGEPQLVKYTDESIDPHKVYQYNGNKLKVLDENNKEIDIYDVADAPPLSYFKHEPDRPLKYCVSKNHIIFTNPKTVPILDGAQTPSGPERNKYYSYINLKIKDTENYNYVFKRFFKSDSVETYSYIQEIEILSIEDLEGDYDEDLTLPLQTEGPFVFEESPQGGGEPAKFEVTFVGQVVQLKSSDGDGFRNEARYSYSVSLITPGKGFKKGEIYTETLAGVNGNPDLTFKFKIKEVGQTTATDNVDVIPGGDISNYSLDQILAGLQQDFENKGIDKAVVVGNGIYLENSTEFSISTTEIAVADVINSQKLEDDLVPIARVNTVAELPLECYDGFIVQVTNSFDGRNDYYLQYKAESNTKDELNLTKSDGYWEEIAKPFERYNPENVTLPHMITVARESDQIKFAFIVSKIQYKKRTAGTALNNPSMFTDFSPITAINYYKNRLFFMTAVGTVVTSKAGDIADLFLKTAVTTSLDDPIDLIANSNQRVPIHGSAVVNNGLVMFGDSEQYTLTTANDVLTTETASVTKVSNYTFDSVSNPIYLGTNLGFISSGLSRFYEMTNVYDRGPVDINERSQPIFNQFGQGFNMPVSSREQSQVIVYRKYNKNFGPLNRSMYLYRFRQENSQESSQTSWVRWQVSRPIAYVSMPRDKLFVILDDGQLYKIESGTINNTTNPGLLGGIPRFKDGWTDQTPNTDGVDFRTTITFPTIYPRSKEVSDITSNLIIHRLKISTSLIGTYMLRLVRDGYDDYNTRVEQTPADEYGANIPPLYGEHVETVPVYTRNTACSVTMTTDDDAPLTLRSMTWEGDWNPPYYRRA